MIDDKRENRTKNIKRGRKIKRRRRRNNKEKKMKNEET